MLGSPLRSPARSNTLGGDRRDLTVGCWRACVADADLTGGKCLPKLQGHCDCLCEGPMLELSKAVDIDRVTLDFLGTRRKSLIH